MGKINKSKSRDILPNNWPVLFKSVMKGKERQWNCYVLERIRDMTTRCNVGSGNRKKTSVKNWY